MTKITRLGAIIMNAASAPDIQNCVFFGYGADEFTTGQTRSAILIPNKRTKARGSARVGKYQKRSKRTTVHKINQGEIAGLVIKLMRVSID
jgi:hypothetical protein